MNYFVISATEKKKWRSILDGFDNLDCCYLPEYHLAYQSRDPESNALMFVCVDGKKVFAYPFMLRKIPNDLLTEINSYYDISSVYGYAGPVANSKNTEFLSESWRHFDTWANEQNIINEFTRFSFYSDSLNFKHPNCIVEYNRWAAVSNLTATTSDNLSDLGPKTRNLLRKAEKNNLILKELPFVDHTINFKSFYNTKMKNNGANHFFLYDDSYYNELIKLKDNEIRYFEVHQGEEVIAAVLVLIYQEYALYHLGAVKDGANEFGSSNFYLYFICRKLKEEGLKLFVLGGGRTTDENDSLLKFKLRNSNSRSKFFVGKRILNQNIYDKLVKNYYSNSNNNENPQNLQFYRSA